MSKRAIYPDYKVPYNGKWINITNKSVEALAPPAREALDSYIYEYQINPLAFSLVHGAPRPDGTNDAIAMINDYESNLILLTAGNQSGKSFLGAIFTALRIIPTDPNWLCFKHGIKWQPWKGPQILIAASYTWDSVNILWQTYQKILPRAELGAFAPSYGIFQNETTKARMLSFNRYEAKQLRLECGSQIVFLCYKQSLSQWESRQCDIAHCDEQIPEDQFDALSQRQLTRGDYTPIIMTLTGHIIPDRPDTGAAGWIKQKVVDRGVTKGRKVNQYRIRIEDVPDEIMSPEAKERARIQWVVEPQATNNEVKMREAEARYYGGWQVGGGLILSEFSPNIHVIDEFDYKKYKPTYYRMIDHGQNPCAAAVFAMMPWGDAVMIKEYYEYGKSIEDNVLGILDMCGNTRKKLDEYEENGITWSIYEEIMSGMELYASELDCRSFGKKSEIYINRNLGSLYNQFGCTCTPATGSHDKIIIPMLKEWLSLSKERKHILEHIGRKYDPEMARFGAPRLYFFKTCQNVISEISRWIGEDKADHLISVSKFFTSRDRGYHGDYGVIEVKEESQEPHNSITGY
jgi:hypothetical protein